MYFYPGHSQLAQAWVCLASCYKFELINKRKKKRKEKLSKDPNVEC